MLVLADLSNSLEGLIEESLTSLFSDGVKIT